MRPTRRHVLPVLALAAGLTGAAPALGADGTRVWMTTGDRQNLLKQQSDASMAAPAAGVPTITIDPSQRFQRIDGFGASITDSSAHLLAESKDRDAIMRDLFSTKDGIGLSYLRQPMGASDFVKGPHYTYDDMPVGKTDFGMTRFSVAHDEKQILPLLRQALRHNRNLKVMGTPWSPPAWMKDPESPDVRRPLHRRQALLRRLHEVLRQVRAGLRARGRAGRRGHAAERAAEPLPVRVSGDGLPRPGGGAADQVRRAGVPEGGDRHEDPRLRPQLVAAPERRRAAGREPAVREGAARRPGGQALARRHGLPLLLGRPERAVGRSRPRTRTATSTSRSARASSPATRRRRSRTRCTGTRAS